MLLQSFSTATVIQLCYSHSALLTIPSGLRHSTAVIVSEGRFLALYMRRFVSLQKPVYLICPLHCSGFLLSLPPSLPYSLTPFPSLPPSHSYSPSLPSCVSLSLHPQPPVLLSLSFLSLILSLLFGHRLNDRRVSLSRAVNPSQITALRPASWPGSLNHPLSRGFPHYCRHLCFQMSRRKTFLCSGVTYPAKGKCTFRSHVWLFCSDHTGR